MSDGKAWLQRIQQQSSQRDGDHRSPFQRDKARILHSAAFRRLQAKTQVLGVGMSDFYRTRLTHSLEASQIGQGIAAQLRSKYPELTTQLGLNDTLIEGLCLAQDIGHPPFETKHKKCMQREFKSEVHHSLTQSECFKTRFRPSLTVAYERKLMEWSPPFH